MDTAERNRLVQQHLDAIAKLQAADTSAASTWPPPGFYWLFHIVTGATLGLIGSMVSLMVNVVGALVMDLPPLKLIQVYLTFPMGERALTISGAENQGMILFVGCVLYLVTGALYGILFHLIMRWYFADAATGKRWIVGSVLGLALWIVNFYLILSWLQPVLLGGNWIVSMVPVWVGAGTHLVFAWTMLLVAGFGRFEGPNLHQGSAE